MHGVMQVKVLILVYLLALGSGLCGCVKTETDARGVSAAQKPVTAEPSAGLQTKVDFNNQIRPLLEARCTPCHFVGGKVFEQLPFDRPETIKRLGTKLFTRLKDENDQRLIRDFLAQ